MTVPTQLMLQQGDAWLDRAVAPDGSTESDPAILACAYYLRVIASQPAGGGLAELLALAQQAKAQRQGPTGNGPVAPPPEPEPAPAPNRAARRKAGGKP
jgi:hypothetical protein